MEKCSPFRAFEELASHTFFSSSSAKGTLPVSGPGISTPASLLDYGGEGSLPGCAEFPLHPLCQWVSLPKDFVQIISQGRSAGHVLPAASLSHDTGQDLPHRMQLGSPASGTWWSPVSSCRKQALEDTLIFLFKCLSRL